MRLRANVTAAVAAALFVSGLATATTATAAAATPAQEAIKAGGAMQARADGPATVSQAAAGNVSQVRDCFGHKVRRCLWINIDHRKNRVRVYGRAKQGPNGAYYDVAVNRLTYRSSFIDHSAYSRDRDGWHLRKDVARTNLESCKGGRRYEFTIHANFRWRNAYTGNKDSTREYLHGWFRC